MSTKIVFGVLAGLAAGVVLGILFAPEEGSQTRRKITDKGSDVMDGLKDKLSELLADVEVTNSPKENQSKTL